MGLKPEAASPSFVYRVLAVRKGGGIWVGLLSPTSWGAIVLSRKHFQALRALANRTSGVPSLVPSIPIGRVFKTFVLRRVYDRPSYSHLAPQCRKCLIVRR